MKSSIKMQEICPDIIKSCFKQYDLILFSFISSLETSLSKNDSITQKLEVSSLSPVFISQIKTALSKFKELEIKVKENEPIETSSLESEISLLH